MTLTKYQQLSYRLFGVMAEEKANEKLKDDLDAAHITIRASAYLSVAWLSSLLALLISFTVIIVMVFLIFPLLHITLGNEILLLFLCLPALIGGVIYIGYVSLPATKAKSRGKKIDIHLAYAINFISAMSSAGVTPTEIFKSLSKQDIYGEIKEEAAWIYRDVALLGTDILTAIRANIKRTPSQKHKEFLQGMIVTVTSGGSLKSYFMIKADQFMRENRQAQKQRIESLGIMAESYVTAAVAGILLILIVIPLMMIIGVVSGSLSISQFESQMMFLRVIVFLIIPLIHIGFAVVVKGMSVSG